MTILDRRGIPSLQQGIIARQWFLTFAAIGTCSRFRGWELPTRGSDRGKLGKRAAQAGGANQSYRCPATGGVGAAVGAAPPPRGAVWVRVLPSGTLADTNSPPGSPFRMGRAVNVTLSPNLSVLDF